MKLDELLGAVAEEAGSTVVDEVRRYFGFSIIIVVVLVLGVGVVLAARFVRAFDEPASETERASVAEEASEPAVQDYAARAASRASEQRLADAGWGADTIATQTGQ